MKTKKNLKRFVLSIAMLFALLAIINRDTKAQTQPITLPRLEGIPRDAVLVNTDTYMVAGSGEHSLENLASERLTCGASSPNPTWYVTGSTIRLSFGQVLPVKNAPETIIGSWTVRSIFPASSGHPETVVAYQFDGKFTGYTITAQHTNAPKYILRGKTNNNISFCQRPNTPGDNTPKDIKISGVCGVDKVISFEVTTPNGVYAKADFKGDVDCGKVLRGYINNNLDRH